MTAPKTTAQRQQSWRERRKQDGFTEVRGIWARPEHHRKIREAAARVVAKELK